MWVCLNKSFLSIVYKDCEPDELLVRARVKTHITNVFPSAKVRASEHTDYRFRAVIKRSDVESAMVDQVKAISYSNFKSSVRSGPLHDAYMRVWSAMHSLQTGFSGRGLFR